MTTTVKTKIPGKSFFTAFDMLSDLFDIES